MGEYVKVHCDKCHNLIGESWVEEIEKPMEIEITVANCECIEVDDSYDNGFEDGKEEGYRNGHEEGFESGQESVREEVRKIL